MEFQGENDETIMVNDLMLNIQRSQRKTMALVAERDGSLTIKVPLDCQDQILMILLERRVFGCTTSWAKEHAWSAAG